MKLKAFDIDDVLYKSKIYKNGLHLKEIKQKLSPYVLYYVTNDSIGICLADQKKNILNVLKEYGEVNTIGNFINADTFLCTGDYGWDDIILGNYELNGEEVWMEFGKVLKENEQILIDSGNEFEVEWNKLQKFALKNIFDNMIEDTKKEIEYAEKDFYSRKGMYINKDLREWSDQQWIKCLKG